MAFQIQDLERLLRSDIQIDAEIYGVPLVKLRDIASTYKAEVDYIKKMDNFYTVIVYKKVSVTLNTMKKTWN